MIKLRPIIDEDKVKKCPKQYVLAFNDALSAISGKWKLPIIASILCGINRFKELQGNLDKISPRMLSRELRELEVEGLVERKVFLKKPVLIEYSLTESGRHVTTVMDALLDWGLAHRRQIMKPASRSNA